MKIYIINAISITSLLMLSVVSMAQEGSSKTPAERAAKLTEWMKTNLSLTEVQLPQIEGINLKYANKMEELKNSSAGKRQKFKTLQANDSAKDAGLKAVLNSDQFKTYESKKEELKEKLKEEAKKRNAIQSARIFC